jgi:AcrR family transcriptional regulator
VAADATGTRARILDTARQLMNEEGYSRVSLRIIAARAGISHGNLCYHYANVERIVFALVEELAANSEAQMTALASVSSPLQMLAELQKQTFALMTDYRFFFLDYVAIVRALPSLRTWLNQLKSRRRKQFVLFVTKLREDGLVVPEPQPGHDRTLFAQYELMTDFWVSHAQIAFGGLGRAISRHYEKLAFDLLLPLLTESGRRQYDQLRF